MLFMATYMELEDNLLSEISQSQKDKDHTISNGILKGLIHRNSKMVITRGWRVWELR